MHYHSLSLYIQLRRFRRRLKSKEIASITNASGDINEKINANENLADWLWHSR